MNESSILLMVAVATGVFGILSEVVKAILGRKIVKTEQKSNEGNAAESLSNAAKALVDTYNEDVVEPLKVRLSALELEDCKKSTRINELVVEIKKLEVNLERADCALEYLIRETRDTHPVEVERAIRIRKGE